MPRTTRRILPELPNLPHVKRPMPQDGAVSAYVAACQARTTARRTKAGTQDQRFGPRIAKSGCHSVSPFTLADYAVSRQHAADLADCGNLANLEPTGTGDMEVWRVADSQRGVSHYLWRMGARIAVQVHWSAGEADLVRRYRDMDAAWNDVRRACRMPAGTHMAEAAHADATLAALPAWLTTAPA